MYSACSQCVDRIRTDLVAVLDCAAAMPEEALEAGIDSEAFALAGPVAHLGTWTRNAIAARDAYELADLTPALIEKLLDDPDERDPYWVLGGWERQLRRLLGDDYVEVSTTLTGSIGYLNRQLPTLAARERQADTISGLRGAVRKVRAHLEAVLHDSRAPERGAPCPACAETLGVDGADPEAKHAPRLQLRRADWDTTGASDTWVCPDNPGGDHPHIWTNAAYRLRVGTDYRAHATWLTAADMTTEHGISASTLRTWADRGLPGTGVKLRKRTHQGRTEYDVTAAKAAHQARAAG